MTDTIDPVDAVESTPAKPARSTRSSTGTKSTTRKASTSKSSTSKSAASKSTASKSSTSRTTKSTSTRSTSSRSASPTGAGRGKLVIVESPTKARSISKYLGAGYTVKASNGHIRDLPKSTLGVEVENDFAPKYLIPRDKNKVVKELKESVAKAREIYLATDPDREGEAIAWHLMKATDADFLGKQIHRVVFHEITPAAVRAAMDEPRDIDMQLVDAQQARRILDRLVGYGVSPLLWKKVKRGLSAGRVQSAALRIVVEREREITAFQPVEYWTLDADLSKRVSGEPKKSDLFTAALSRIGDKKAELSNETDTMAVVQGLEGASYRVQTVTRRESQRRPQAPFTTSTLQQESSRKLGYAPRRTMQLAQELYEGIDVGAEGTVGLITYMRTDSTNVAGVAQQMARETITERFGADYVPEKPPMYVKKSKGAQEAHEAVRPTAPSRTPEQMKGHLSSQQFRLYQLIWQRFIASQMRPALLDNTGVDIAAGPADQVASGKPPYTFRATGSVVKFPGFMAVYQAGRDDGDTDELDKGALPQLSEGEDLDLRKLNPDQHFTQPPPRYTEATLIKVLEELGIGRPSTYAPTVETIKARNYVATEERRLIPTELGFIVNDQLVEHFGGIFDPGFTARLEEDLDEIATGERAWVPTMHAFYEPFTKDLEKAEQTMERVQIRDEPTDEVCDLCGRPMVIKLGRFGKFLACTGFPECRNAKPLLTRTGIECPTCHEGEVVERRSKKGRTFYGCERYPACDFVAWNKPVNANCPECGSYLVEAGRNGQVKCPNCKYTGTHTPSPVPEAVPAD
ncbi:MAG TPA: type I DNA topoisomerase [Thermomicrobiales bacterium]|nr:type I DNA topoisomerase [Thermomicrobiales bacterium]